MSQLMARKAPPPRGLRATSSPKAGPRLRRPLARLLVELDDALRESGAAGRVLKGANQRWYMGHGVDRFESAGLKWNEEVSQEPL